MSKKIVEKLNAIFLIADTQEALIRIAAILKGAVEQGYRIGVSRKYLQIEGKEISFPSLPAKVKECQKKIQEAIKKEEFEQAALYRDQEKKYTKRIQEFNSKRTIKCGREEPKITSQSFFEVKKNKFLEFQLLYEREFDLQVDELIRNRHLTIEE